ncbi:MAG: aldo/keto reductase [Bacteroidetes bacterium]|nr:aldo/keto reductase [Bacteroidota bacterium]
MEYSFLGKSGQKVSKICLGTMTFGEQNTEAEGHLQLDYAVSEGVNFIDTAEMYPIPANKDTYGRTEEIIGSWLKGRGDRHQLVIASKIIGPGAFNYMRPALNFSPASIHTALHNSLRRLQTDYIDLYQLHWPERNTNMFGVRGYKDDGSDAWQDNMLEILQTMKKLVNEGKIRFFGVSNETPWGLQRFIHLASLHDLPVCVSIQNPYNLVNRLFEVGLAEISIREKAGLLAYSPLAFGTLSGKYLDGTAESSSRLVKYASSPRLVRYNSAFTQGAIKKYVDLARDAQLSPSLMALAFVNSRPFLTSNIVGATNLSQLKENISSINLKLPKDLLERIELIHTSMPDPAP